MDDHTELAKKFLSEVITGWMLGDLENMVTKIPPVEKGVGNCNFPIALYIFTCIEFLGFLTSDVIIPDTSKDYTKRRIWFYINSYFNDNYLFQLRPYEDNFVSIFRHGLSHEFWQVFRSSTDNLKSAIFQNSNKIADRMISRYNDLQASNFIKFLPKNIPTPTLTPSSNISIAEPIDTKTTTTLPYDSGK